MFLNCPKDNVNQFKSDIFVGHKNKKNKVGLEIRYIPTEIYLLKVKKKKKRKKKKQTNQKKKKNSLKYVQS